MTHCKASALSFVLLAASCAGPGQTQSTAIQPQDVTGPCTVKNFFILNYTAVHADMVMDNNGQSCTFAVFNPAQQVFVSAAFITEPARNGLAKASLITGGFQGAATYTPRAGYTGADHFTVTFEPQDRAVNVAVMIQTAEP